jgi:hypothetical protein
MLVWLFGELLRDFCNMIYYQFQSVLQAIMERNWRGTEHHLLTPEQKEQWLRVQQDKKGQAGKAQTEANRASR